MPEAKQRHISSIRKLVAIMFTDIVGYTKMMGEDEQIALSLLRKNRNIHKKYISEHHGQFLKEMGDGMLASFENSSDAVVCAAAIQKASIEKDIALRIGIHMGEVIFENKDVFGDGVNIASRIQPLAEPNQILISETVHYNVQNKPGITTRLIGERALKNVEKTRIIYAAEVHDEFLTPRTKEKKKNLLSPWFIGLCTFFILLFGLGGYWLGHNAQDPLINNPVIRYKIDLDAPLGRTGRQSLTFSPNGKHLCYVSGGQLILKSLDDNGNGTPLAGLINPRQPCFSADGNWIVFEDSDNDRLMKVPVNGGNPRQISSLQSGTLGINCYEGRIIFGQDDGLYQVDENGGISKKLYPRDSSALAIWNPQLLPDQKTIIYNLVDNNDQTSSLVKLWQLDGQREPETLLAGAFDARYLKSGHLAFIKDGSLQVIKFNLDSKKLIGIPQIITSDPIENNGRNGQFAFNNHGTLVSWSRNSPESERNLIWIDLNGKIEKISREPGMFMSPTISRDGQQIAVDQVDEDGSFDIVLFNPVLGTATNFITANSTIRPVWHPDNINLTYFQFDEPRGVYTKPTDLSYPPKLLFESDEIIHLGNWSNDGRYLVFRSPEGLGYYDSGDSTLNYLDFINAAEGADFFYPSISPDGKWLSYTADDETEDYVYVVPFPGPGRQHRISVEEGFAAIWASDMKTIYFIGQDNAGFNVSEVEINTKPQFTSAKPEVLFLGDYSTRYQFANTSIYQYGNTGFFDIHPDGDRFLMQQNSSDQISEGGLSLDVIVNWPALID